VVFLQESSSSFSPQVSRFLPHLIPLLQTSRQSRPVASRSSSLALATTSNLSAGGWRLHPVGLCSGVRRAGGRESAGRGAPENEELAAPRRRMQRSSVRGAEGMARVAARLPRRDAPPALRARGGAASRARVGSSRCDGGSRRVMAAYATSACRKVNPSTLSHLASLSNDSWWRGVTTTLSCWSRR
jgi:hypothetical protein